MQTPKRQEIPGLTLVGTPIGNLGDISPRVVEAFQQADTIACEDTRVTQKLLNHLEIQKPLVRLDEEILEKKLPSILKALEQGQAIVFCTDAGMPGVSDPGARLVVEVVKAQIPIQVIPGPSALTAAWSLSGFQTDQVRFCGFFPRKTALKKSALDEVRSHPKVAFFWFESPKRIRQTLDFCESEIDFSFSIFAVKELTKKFEEKWHGESSLFFENIKQYLNSEGERGEWVIGLMNHDSSADQGYRKEDWANALKCLRDCGVSRKESVLSVSQNFGVSKNQIYDASLEIFSKKRRS